MPARAGLTPSAHDVARDFRVTSALQGTEVSVPRPVLLCEDAAVLGGPFAVGEHVDGAPSRPRQTSTRSTTGRSTGASTSSSASSSPCTVSSPAAVGLSYFGRPDGYLRRQVTLWSTQWSA